MTRPAPQFNTGGMHPAIVESAQGGVPHPDGDGTRVGMADEISYTVTVYLGGKVQLDPVADIVPSNPRPRGGNIRSAGPGDACTALMFGDTIKIEIVEHFNPGGCEP